MTNAPHMAMPQATPGKHLYVSDLDGTLLQPDGTLSARAAEILRALLLHGVPLSVASARSIDSIRYVLGGLPFHLPVIELNGSCLTDFHTARPVEISVLQTELFRELHDFMTRRGHRVHCSVQDDRRQIVLYETARNDGERWYLQTRADMGDERFHPVPDLPAAATAPVLSLGAIGRREPMVALDDELRRFFPKRVSLHLFENPYFPGWWWLTVHGAAATKAAAVLRLARRAGFAPDQLVVFGDDTNDVGMFEVAGRRVAVQNAIAAVRALADETIGPNETDSVTLYLAREAGIAPWNTDPNP